MNEPLSPDLLRKMHAYWRAANFLSVGQIYLRDNSLLKEPLHLKHVKPRLLGIICPRIVPMGIPSIIPECIIFRLIDLGWSSCIPWSCPVAPSASGRWRRPRIGQIKRSGARLTIIADATATRRHEDHNAPLPNR